MKVQSARLVWTKRYTAFSSDVMTEPNAHRREHSALQRDCSPARSIPIDDVVARGQRTMIGQFRCPLEHPSFRDSGPASDCIVVFPRSSVWIRHEGSKPFVADPTVA